MGGNGERSIRLCENHLWASWCCLSRGKCHREPRSDRCSLPSPARLVELHWACEHDSDCSTRLSATLFATPQPQHCHNRDADGDLRPHYMVHARISEQPRPICIAG